METPLLMHAKLRQSELIAEGRIARRQSESIAEGRIARMISPLAWYIAVMRCWYLEIEAEAC